MVAARQVVVQRHVYRLSDAELNGLTGEIRWPAVFGAAKFAAERARMDELFARQVRYGSPDRVTAAEIARCSVRLAKALRSDIGMLPREEYFAAQRFLLGLRFGA